MKTYKIINDSGIHYPFLKAFGHPTTPWLGQIVKGGEVNHYGCITVEKPFGITGTYTADASHFEEVKN
jgi:hypothetical protein